MKCNIVSLDWLLWSDRYGKGLQLSTLSLMATSHPLEALTDVTGSLWHLGTTSLWPLPPHSQGKMLTLKLISAPPGLARLWRIKHDEPPLSLQCALELRRTPQAGVGSVPWRIMLFKTSVGSRRWNVLHRLREMMKGRRYQKSQPSRESIWLHSDHTFKNSLLAQHYFRIVTVAMAAVDTWAAIPTLQGLKLPFWPLRILVAKWNHFWLCQFLSEESIRNICAV